MYYGWLDGYFVAKRRSREVAKEALSAKQSARRAENVLFIMEDALDRQALVIRTLLTICDRKGVFNEQEFREVMNEIDLSDGRLDGKFKDRPKPRECPECGKTNGKRAVSCMYCGAILPGREIM